MRKETMQQEQSAEQMQTINTQAIQTGTDEGDAFEYLQSLPRNHERPALDSYKRERGGLIIDEQVAEDFTTTFRNVNGSFDIPVSWTIDKSALVNLLGITSYQGYAEVNGIRFYAGINPDNQLTLIAVSTMAGTGCNEDLTVGDEYPYYDYADPCPTNCSNRGNLRVIGNASVKVVVAQ